MTVIGWAGGSVVRYLATFMLVLLLPISVTAQPQPNVDISTDWYQLHPLEWALVGATTADIVATELVIHRGGYEHNPFMQSRAARIGFNAGQTALLVYLSRRLTAAGKGNAAKAVLLVPAVAHGAAAGWNVSVTYRVNW